MHDPLVDETQKSAAARLAADEDIGRDIEVFEKIELLMHERDAGLRGLGDGQGGMLLAVDQDRAGRRRHDATEDLHHGRLAGAVLPDEAEHLARRERQADAVERRHARVGLGDGAEFKKGFRHGDAEESERLGPPGWATLTWFYRSLRLSMTTGSRTGGRGRSPEKPYFFSISRMDAANSLTFDLSITLVGMICCLLAGTME